MRIGAAILPVATAGCLSFSYVDDQNVRHVIGFVDLALPPADGAAARKDAPAQAVTVTSVGLSVHAQPGNSGSVVFGYSKQTVLTLGDNACVDLGRPGPCSTLRASASSTSPSARRKK